MPITPAERRHIIRDLRAMDERKWGALIDYHRRELEKESKK